MDSQPSASSSGLLLFAMLDQVVHVPQQGLEEVAQPPIVQPMLGFVAEQVERITPASLIRPIPLAPSILLGLAVCLGRVMTVVDVTGLLAPRTNPQPRLEPSHFVVVADWQASAQQVVFAVGASAGISLSVKPVGSTQKPAMGIGQILQSERHAIWLLDIPLLLTMVWQTCAASSRKFATQRSLP